MSVKLQNAFDLVGEEREITLEAEFIRDERTVEFYTSHIVRWRTKFLMMLTMDCTYSVADIEFGDKVGVAVNAMPARLWCKTWMVQEHRMVPVMKDSRPKIKLTLLEMPDGAIDGCVPFGTTPPEEFDYQEAFTGTVGEDDFQEVYISTSQIQEEF